MSSTISVAALAIAFFIFIWKRRYLKRKITWNLKQSVTSSKRSDSPNLHASAFPYSAFHAASIPIKEGSGTQESPLSDVAAYPASSPDFRASRIAASNTLVQEPQDRNTESQQSTDKQDDTSRIPGSSSSDPVLIELRKIRSQMALLQLRVDDIEGHSPDDMESLPEYNQVASRR